MTVLPAVIVAAERQMEAVARLAGYCRTLDGTEIVIIAADEGQFLPYPICNNASFHRAANIMRGKPFIWLEPDSVPLKPGWRDALTREYFHHGKPFLLSGDGHPHDLIGGIGVYGGDSYFLIPRDIRQGGWDTWMVRHLNPLIAFTSLIQHSYAQYTAQGHIKRRHSFPLDSAMLRSNAVIFHADPRQTLIPCQERRFFHTGDIGDAIASLAAVKQMGGGEFVVGFQPNTGIREPMKGKRFDMLKPLLEAQSYVKRAVYSDSPVGIAHDFSNFRASKFVRGDNLATWQARHIGADITVDPWLSVQHAKNGRVIVARSARYQNRVFPWKTIVERYGEQILFVGLPDEHEQFERVVGRKVEYQPTQNLLELAQLIAGCSLFIGNQSCPFWIAAGLGVPLIQETFWGEANSIVRRPNATYADSPQAIRLLQQKKLSLTQAAI